MSRILVIGSLNIDIVQQVPRLPLLGETLAATSLQVFNGGKGNNQAAAAALLGQNVAIGGMVGADEFGKRLKDRLHSMGVDVGMVKQSSQPTGTAMILVLPDGENVIVISKGANDLVDVESAQTWVENLDEGDFLLCQLETPVDAVRAAFVRARHRAATTILDPAPMQPLPPELLRATTIITPNQDEAARLLGRTGAIEELNDARDAASAIHQMGPETVIIKLDKLGCVMADGRHVSHFPALPVRAVDTTAAGDCFNGALAVALAEGLAMTDAVRFANAAAALSVTRAGAVDSMPSRAALDLFRNRH